MEPRACLPVSQQLSLPGVNTHPFCLPSPPLSFCVRSESCQIWGHACCLFNFEAVSLISVELVQRRCSQMYGKLNSSRTRKCCSDSILSNHIFFSVSHRTAAPSCKQATPECALVCFPEKYGRGGGDHGPGGLEGQVYGPGGSAHEVQNADYQDPRPDCWQGRLNSSEFGSVLIHGQTESFNHPPIST